MDPARKNVIKIFKEVGFKIEIQTHLKIVNFLDVTFNLANGTYRPYKKANESLLYINTSSNHPPQVIKQLPTSISKQLSNNSSSEGIFNASKYEYETALRNSGYQENEVIFNKKKHRKKKRNRNQNIIWFNPPFSRNVTTNVAKRFLSLLEIGFSKSNKLHQLFNRNTVNVSYYCTKDLSNIIKTHTKKGTNEKITPRDQCNCKKKNDCSLDGNCQTSHIIYKCIASTTINPDKIYLGAAEGNFKNHKTSFKNREKANDTMLSNYVWEVTDKYKETPSLKWSIVKSVPKYSNITKKCLLCLHQKLEIINYLNQEVVKQENRSVTMLTSNCFQIKKVTIS